MADDGRWDRLFADLEAQIESDARLGLEGEVAERTRISRAEVSLEDRVQARLTGRISVRTLGGGRADGDLVGAGQGWLLVTTPDPVLVLTSALSGVVGLGNAVAKASAAPGRLPRVGVRQVLRALARDRSPVRLRLVDGEETSGTLDVVGRDHADLAEHPWGEPRRTSAVQAVRSVPFAALAVLRPAPGTSSLPW